MLKLGIEPKTFALLARRSNQLSYSSTDLSSCNSPLNDGIPRSEFTNYSNGGVLSVPNRPLQPD